MSPNQNVTLSLPRELIRHLKRLAADRDTSMSALMAEALADAMIVQAAAELGCDILWTEDLKDGQVMRGVRIRNPFGGVRR